MPSLNFLTARRLWLVLALGCVGLVVGSFTLTALFKLHPCYMCMFQRLMFLLMATFAVLAAFIPARPLAILSGIVVLLCAAGGAGVATQQVWLQNQPGAEFTCGGADPSQFEIFMHWLGQLLPALFWANGNCASKELVILGLSLAGWAQVAFVASLLVGAWALWRGRRSG